MISSFLPRGHRCIWLRFSLLFGLALCLTGSLVRADKKALSLPAPPSRPIAQPSYFFTIDLDSHYQFVGTGALTPEDATRANCYRFIYDSEGRPLQIEYQRAGTPMPDPFLGVPRIDFEHATGIERRWYRNLQGAAVADVDGIYGEELTLNRSGYPTDVTNLDASGARARDSSGVMHYVRTLDAEGRLSIGHRIGLFGQPITDDDGYYESHTIYDEQGRAIERGNYDRDGNPLNDKDGVATVRTTYTLYPDSTQITKSYFDASGLAVEEKSSGVHALQRSVDQRGFTTSESYYDSTGTPTLTLDGEIHERRMTYDERGNVLSEAYFDVDDKPKDHKGLDYARLVYKYDDKNRVVEKSYFGDDGTPQVLLSVGAAIIRQEYDAQGNMVRRQFFDGLGHASPHVTYGSPAIRVKVDGDTTIVTLRNDKDRPMKNPVHGYYAFSYNATTDKALSPTNQFFDRRGHPMTALRVFVINPHLHALKTTPVMKWSARLGVIAGGLGALLACYLALRKSFHVGRRRVYVPTALERLLGWFATFAILEGSLRFFMTIYWAWVGYENGRMGHTVYVVETLVILVFLYRLYRLTVTLRVLNIEREDLHRLIRAFFSKTLFKPEWIERRGRYITPPFEVRVRYFRQKYHAYLGFLCRRREGRDLARGLAQFIRAQAKEVQAPPFTRTLAFYYPSVALCYLLLAGTAFYTLAQLLRGF